MSSVLFDVPGPKARARNNLLTVVATLVILAVSRVDPLDALRGG